jgi:tRNA 2-thiouridine synthesizing protein A
MRAFLRRVAGAEHMARTRFDRELDASGLNCPLPILRAKQALAGMQSGQVLQVIATDPGSVRDFETFSRQTGNQLLESREQGGKLYFLVRRAETRTTTGVG